MQSANKARRAAMSALVAAALMAGVQQANAGIRRLPMDDPPSLVPQGRQKIAGDAGGADLFARVRVMLSSVRRLPDEVGLRLRHLPMGRLAIGND